MDRRIVNFLTAQFSTEDLSAALNALLNPRTKRATTRTTRKGRKAAGKGKRKNASEPIE